jgi:TM2 domain-containing membrane protein YozV
LARTGSNLGQNGLGIVYALFCWTFIPAIVAFCELFVISKRVGQYNERITDEVATMLRANATPAAGAPTIAEQLRSHICA